MSQNHKIILASQSGTRQTMLKNAGVAYKVIKPVIDEMAVAKEMLAHKSPPDKIALELARKKALTVAKKNPEALVIGSDQILVVEGKIMHKAHNVDEAREKLKSLRGKTHKLISAVAVAKGGTVFWSHEDSALLTMRGFDDAFLDAYCAQAGEALIRSVGAYEVEGLGAWLLSGVDGDHFTILGMPLRPLLAYLNEYHGMMP